MIQAEVNQQTKSPNKAIEVFALSYAGAGVHVLPLQGILEDGRCGCGVVKCPNPGRHFVSGYDLKQATADEEQIEAWFNIPTIRNLAVATGKVSGLLGLRIHKDEGGDVTLRNLERSLGKLPKELVVNGGRDGQQIWVRYPAELDQLETFSLGSGLEVVGDHDYLISPPSVRASGNTYSWKGSVFRMPQSLPELPGKWVQRLASLTETHLAAIG